MQPGSNPYNYNQIGTSITVICSNIIAILLASGHITPATASAANGAVPLIGAIILALVMNGAMVIGNQWHRLRYGPVPLLPAAADASTGPALPPATSSRVAPSYAAASTGPGDAPAIPADVPKEAI